MKSKDLIWLILGLLGAIFLIAVGVVGIRANTNSANILVAIIFIGGGIYLFLRIGYRLIKKLGVLNS